MATQSSISSIAPLFAVTILTSLSVIASGDARSTEQSTQLAVEGMKPKASGRARGTSALADAVAEARWARPERDHILGAAGRILLAEKPAKALNRGTGTGLASEGHPDADEHHSGSLFLDGRLQDQAECGPSPATAAEIRQLVTEAARRHQVDVAFAIAIVTAESRLDRLRNSPKGARGPMQLMPETAKRFGVTDICDPARNIDGGVRYLHALIDEFGNPLLVAAAYNAGEGRVREHGGIPPFRETVRYVAEVVNLQMGLARPGPTPRDGGASTHNRQPVSTLSGVVTSRERRRWVGGVMHF